ncbi:hypothetical protein QQ045_008399 [Rhodiola kirilowii]
MLTAHTEEEEVLLAVTKLNPTSAPGPDGFTGSFYLHCWDIVKHDLVKAVQTFFDGWQLSSSISATNLILIPKTLNVTRLDQLRPISLCNFVHKIISAILNATLSKVLPLIIS